MNVSKTVLPLLASAQKLSHERFARAGIVGTKKAGSEYYNVGAGGDYSSKIAGMTPTNSYFLFIQPESTNMRDAHNWRAYGFPLRCLMLLG